jgi:hypothetical protein
VHPCRGSRRRRSTGRRGQAEQEPGTPLAPSQATLLSLVELLGLPSARQQCPERPAALTGKEPAAGETDAEGAAPAAPAGSVGPNSGAAAAAAAAAVGPPGAAPAEPQAAAAAAAAAAVRGFVRAQPEEGAHPTTLLLKLVLRLAGTPGAAAGLSAPERVLLVKAAERLHENGESCSLPAACCLVLAELCISGAADAAAGSALGGVAAAGSGGGGEPSGKGKGQPPGRLMLGDKESGRARGKAAQDGARSIPPAQLQQLAEQWLLRHMAATVAVGLEGGGEGEGAWIGGPAPPGTAWPALERPAEGGSEAEAAGGEGLAASASAATATGAATVAGAAVRYWWARGQLEESKGAASEAAHLYQRCLQALEEAGTPGLGTAALWSDAWPGRVATKAVL